jgi:hypothetical protein
MTTADAHSNKVTTCDGHTYAFHFGKHLGSFPVNYPGAGHHAHVQSKFRFGVTLDLDPETATAFANGLLAAVAKLGILPDVSGAVGEVGEG